MSRREPNLLAEHQKINLRTGYGKFCPFQKLMPESYILSMLYEIFKFQRSFWSKDIYKFLWLTWLRWKEDEGSAIPFFFKTPMNLFNSEGFCFETRSCHHVIRQGNEDLELCLVNNWRMYFLFNGLVDTDHSQTFRHCRGISSERESCSRMRSSACTKDAHEHLLYEYAVP